MKFLILNGDYPQFLSWLYKKHRGLGDATYDEQMRVRKESLFGVADFYSSNLKKHGHEAWDIHANNELLQRAWAVEHGLEIPDLEWKLSLKKGIVPWISRLKNRSWFYRVLKEQIQYYRPDILLNQEMSWISTSFLREMKSHVRLLIGQHAATRLSESEDWNVYDLVISSFPPTLEWFRSKQVPAELNRLGFEPRVLSSLSKPIGDVSITFVGSFLSPYHHSRVEWLERLCERFPIRIWSPDINDLDASSPIRQCYAGTVWGTEMYQVLRDSLLTLNHHGDVPPYANNMRMYEATGVGALLITDWKPNLQEMFEPGKEVVTYRSTEECLELIQFYLDHRKEAEEIAFSGQNRTLQNHTYYQRTGEIVDMVERCRIAGKF